MAKKTKEPKVYVPPTYEQLVEEAKKSFFSFRECPLAVCPEPTRYFKLGEQVKMGGLRNCVITEICEGGMYYRFDHDYLNERDKAAPYPRSCMYAWWHDIDHLDFCNTNSPKLFSAYLPGQICTSDISSLFSMMSQTGIVCDPRYQRGYVWSAQDQENLIDAIFNRMTIGTFIFSCHTGYKHTGSTEKSTYINLDGKTIQVDKCNDYTKAIVDGQQRLTTLWKFYTNQFSYKGYYWKDLHFSDQIAFEGHSISYRHFYEEDVPYKDVLKMFIGVNKGVPQDPKHLEAVQQQLNQLGE